jgi:hypothetical protein
MDLDPKIWGPHYWFMLHTISLNYPIRPNDVIKKKYYDLMQNVPSLLPHKISRDTMTALLDAYPVSPYLDSRQSFIQWIHFIHNKTNEILNKPTITLSEFYTRYYDEYKPKPLKQYEFIYWRKKLVYACVLITLVLIIIYIS